MITATMAPSAVYDAQPEVVADRVLRRAELGKMACRLQSRLALAQFKTRNGWEDLTLDMIEPKVEEEIRRKRGGDGEISDSSSSTSELPYPSHHRGLMSSPLKAPFFSDAVGSSNGSTGHRKRTYVASFDDMHSRHGTFALSSPSKRYRSSPPLTAGSAGNAQFPPRSASAYLPPQQPYSGHAAWKDHHQLSHSSPIKPRRQQHFTTEAGPDVSLFTGARRIADALDLTNYTAPQSDTDDELLPTHSFRASSASFGLPSTTTTTATAGRTGPPPSTPPMRSRMLPSNNRRRKKADDAFGDDQVDGRGDGAKTEGADLLLFLAASPSPANPSGRSRMDPPSTPPSKFNSMALPSSMMTTPGGGSMFPNTPGQQFDFSDFVNITPSPAQKPWKTPNLLGSRTPMSVSRRRLTFDDPL